MRSPVRTTPSAPPAPSLSRRLLLSGTALSAALLAGCSHTTNPAVPRDPLARLGAEYTVRSAKDLLDLHVSDHNMDSETWVGVEPGGTAETTVREQIARFIEACYLQPQQLAAIDPSSRRDYLVERTPPHWQKNLGDSYDSKHRMLYATAPRSDLKAIGSGVMAADWFRSQVSSRPGVLLGGSIAIGILEPSTNKVFVVGYRIGATAAFTPEGRIVRGSFATVIAGIDFCAVDKADGALVPAMKDDTTHRKVREDTLSSFLADPRLTPSDLLDPKAAVLSGRDAPNVDDC